ncbi:hypothetical protein FPOAC2_07063 [Fusarium poae]
MSPTLERISFPHRTRVPVREALLIVDSHPKRGCSQEGHVLINVWCCYSRFATHHDNAIAITIATLRLCDFATRTLVLVLVLVFLKRMQAVHSRSYCLPVQSNFFSHRMRRDEL